MSEIGKQIHSNWTKIFEDYEDTLRQGTTFFSHHHPYPPHTEHRFQEGWWKQLLKYHQMYTWTSTKYILNYHSFNIFVLYYSFKLKFSSVKLLSLVRIFVTPWTPARQASLSITNSQSLPKLMSIELVMPSNHLILCRPLVLLPSIFPSIRVFSNESALCSRWPKYWNFSFNINPSNEHPGLISFRMDWLDLLAVQGTLKSLLQHHSSKGKAEVTLS